MSNAALELASRFLLGEEEDGVLAHDDHATNHTDNTKPLRVAAIFIILATGLLGGIPPLFLKVSFSVCWRDWGSGVLGLTVTYVVHIMARGTLNMHS